MTKIPLPDDICAERCVHPESIARVKQNMIDERERLELAELFKMLGDPTRMRILEALTREELCVCDLAQLMDVSASAVSHQLRLLRAARVVRFRKEGKNVFYALDDAHVARLIFEALEHVREGRK